MRLVVWSVPPSSRRHGASRNNPARGVRFRSARARSRVVVITALRPGHEPRPHYPPKAGVPNTRTRRLSGSRHASTEPGSVRGQPCKCAILHRRRLPEGRKLSLNEPFQQTTEAPVRFAPNNPSASRARTENISDEGVAAAAATPLLLSKGHTMSIGLILVIVLIIFLAGGFSGRFGGYGYGYGHGGVGVIGIVVIILIVLLLREDLGRDPAAPAARILGFRRLRTRAEEVRARAPLSGRGLPTISAQAWREPGVAEPKATMPLDSFVVDDGPHSSDGLLLRGRDGPSG